MPISTDGWARFYIENAENRPGNERKKRIVINDHHEEEEVTLFYILYTQGTNAEKYRINDFFCENKSEFRYFN